MACLLKVVFANCVLKHQAPKRDSLRRIICSCASVPTEERAERLASMTTERDNRMQKADFGIMCIGRESNPGLAESSELNNLEWQRPILPLNHQCY
jgi:hypothetical protein